MGPPGQERLRGDVMTILYQIITAGVIALAVWNLFRERQLVEQMGIALVLIPLVLRVLMIK